MFSPSTSSIFIRRPSSFESVSSMIITLTSWTGEPSSALLTVFISSFASLEKAETVRCASRRKSFNVGIIRNLSFLGYSLVYHAWVGYHNVCMHSLPNKKLKGQYILG